MALPYFLTMNMKQKYGSLALVAGASEGLGAAYARSLAASGMDLILIARRRDELEKTSQSIRDQYKVNVMSIACDLAETNVLAQINTVIGSAHVNLFVYNAALPYIGPYLDLPAEEHIRISVVNMITPLKMVHHFGNKMMQAGKGGIVLMTSLAGRQGSGFIATYAATKAFNLVLAESLWYEWRTKGVDIIGCCAGATATPNYINSKPSRLKFFQPPIQQPEDVVNECLQKIGKMPSFISGTQNKLASFFMNRLLPRKTAVSIMGDATRKLYNIEY